jgi:hypothetical protein
MYIVTAKMNFVQSLRTEQFRILALFWAICGRFWAIFERYFKRFGCVTNVFNIPRHPGFHKKLCVAAFCFWVALEALNHVCRSYPKHLRSRFSHQKAQVNIFILKILGTQKISIRSTAWQWDRKSKIQGCRMFLSTRYQNRKTIPNDLKIYQIATTCTKIDQMAIKYTYIHNNFHWKPLQSYPDCNFWFENMPSGNPTAKSTFGFIGCWVNSSTVDLTWLT